MSYKAIEVQGSPGFYVIPGYMGYAITEAGDVINLETRVILKGSKNPDGYINFRLKGDTGHTLTLGLHRLMGLAFDKPEGDITALVVNHLSGVKSDNCRTNLEWTTHRGNIEHAGALGLTEKCQPISVRDVDNNSVIKYPSIIACANALGFSKDAINYRVKVGEERIFPERKQYRHGHGDHAWFQPRNLTCAMAENGTSKAILVRDVITGNVVEYGRMSDVAEYFGVSAATVSTWMERLNQFVPARLIQIKWKSDSNHWALLDNPERLAREHSNKKRVRVFKPATNETWTYDTVVSCAAAHNLSATALNYRLNAGAGKVFTDGCSYSYFSY